MNNSNLLQAAGMFLVPFLIVVISILIGRYWGIYNLRKSSDIKHEQVGSVVGAVFALLAFMLAFTFQIAANRYDARKELLLEEVTNIRTTYLRAGLVPEPFRSGTKKLLVEYVDLRIQVAKDPSKIYALMSRSQAILDSLWNFTETLAGQDRSSEVYALYTSSVNDLVDNYNQRVSMTLEYKIPPTVLWILFIMTTFSMIALGYQLGISGKGSFKLNIVLALVFALVMFLILVLDHPETGLAKLNQKPMLTLQKQLQEK
jgi:CDP-diglyceride synthetase